MGSDISDSDSDFTVSLDENTNRKRGAEETSSKVSEKVKKKDKNGEMVVTVEPPMDNADSDEGGKGDTEEDEIYDGEPRDEVTMTIIPRAERGMATDEIAGTGTMRQNHLNKVPIKKKKDMEKKACPRGDLDVLYKEDQLLAAWKDNKAVYVASNKFGAGMETTVRRFNRTEKKFIVIPCPDVIRCYNKGMGGSTCSTTWWPATGSSSGRRSGGSLSTPGP